MVLSTLFGWEGYKMVRWASSAEFTGGCCDDCKEMPDSESSVNEKDVELGVKEKDVINTKQGNCCGPVAGDAGQPDKVI